MEPTNNRFGGGISESLIHPLVLCALVLVIALLLFLPRKTIIVPLVLTLFLIPKGQQLVLLSSHFTIARILFLIGLGRWLILERGVKIVGGFNSLDRVFTLWAISYLAVFSLQWREGQATIKALGEFLDAMGGYFVIRFAIQNTVEAKRALEAMVAVTVISAFSMIYEVATASNVFGLLGGVAPTTIRDGSVRAQAAFGIFITAGSFGATLMPLLVWLWSDRRYKLISVLGMICATIMVVTCHASTILLTYVSAIGAFAFWPLRRQMQLLRRGLVTILIALHLVMNGPVWSLIQKIDLTGSSSSQHRYLLVDNGIRHVADWWLLGYRNYQNWGWCMWDLANQYVAYAVTGGLATVGCFIAIICKHFANIGRTRKRVDGNRSQEWSLFCMGACLFAHVVGYFGIGYWDQMQFAWFIHLAVMIAITSEINQEDVTAKTRQQIMPVAVVGDNTSIATTA